MSAARSEIVVAPTAPACTVNVPTVAAVEPPLFSALTLSMDGWYGGALVAQPVITSSAAAAQASVNILLRLT
jgi:hypothetical protein